MKAKFSAALSACDAARSSVCEVTYLAAPN